MHAITSRAADSKAARVMPLIIVDSAPVTARHLGDAPLPGNGVHSTIRTGGDHEKTDCVCGARFGVWNGCADRVACARCAGCNFTLLLQVYMQLSLIHISEPTRQAEISYA